VLNILVENFEVTDDVVVRTADRLGFADWSQLTRIHRPELKDAPFSPQTLWRSDEDPEAIFDQIRYQDVLVHHPFESFSSVETFLRVAVEDPHVIAIKMTLYRIGPNSPLIPLLIAAAEAGKQVAVLVELKARFDEKNNIIWARRLESHGIHVVYGFADLKTHAKLCMVVRQEADGIQRYVHTSSGNYNPETAKIYTDVGLFTADPDLVSDVSDVFNYLTGYSNQKEFKSLLVAPVQLRTRLTELIERETAHAREGRPARLVIKCNSVTDDQMIRVLYRASQAGVCVDLIVRGTCSLRPGIRGISENIHVRSIVGRFLEHSRIYSFEAGDRVATYIGSPDLMQRNLDHRIEVLMPVENARVRQEIHAILDSALEDDTNAWSLGPDGSWTRVEPGKSKSHSHHDSMMRRSLKRARRGARERRAG